MACLSSIAFLAIVIATAYGACPADRPLKFCCLNVAPFSTNSGVWGNVCGASDVSPSTLIGARCTSLSSCPSGTILTCCNRFVPGPSGQCALGVNCGSPIVDPPSSAASPTSSTIPEPPLPTGWRKYNVVGSTCFVDNESRVLTNVITTMHNDLTPYSCAAHCQNSGYQFSGVEYESECHCGTGFVNSGNRPASECNMRCSGDSTWTCGGSWRIQVYTST